MTARGGGLALGLLVLSACITPSDAAPPQTPLRQDAPPPARQVVSPSPTPLTPIRWTGQLSQGGLVRARLADTSSTVALDGEPIVPDADGTFLIGFDRDAKPTADLRITSRITGADLRQTLTIAPRAWRIERLDRLPKYPVPDPEFQRLRPAELEQIRAARAQTTDAEGWRQTLQWPVTGRISGLFGAQRIYRGEPGSYHSGTDIAVPTGTIVRAPADGVVILAARQPFTLEGHLLMLDHGQGLNSAFLHLSRIDVGIGDHVRQGQVIGAVGATGRATGPHLHWSLQWKGRKLDPLLVTGPMP
jgi:murein DD-endopeptidase MepM/ murein hydrolase activator NlpD